MLTLNDDVWFIQTPYYMAFIFTKDLDKFADHWEQSELAKLELTQILKD